jgi:putative peptidoglycan lipid II flippase
VSNGGALARAGLTLTGAFLIARILGWLRVIVIGTTFGLTSDLDAFYAAFPIPNLIYEIVAAGAIASAVIPILAGLQATGETDRAWRVASTMLNLMLVLVAALAALAALAAPLLVPLIAPGFDADEQALTVELTRVMLIGPVFLAMGSVATSILNSSGRFAAAAMAPIAYNLALIAAPLLLADAMGIHCLALGVVVGSMLHFAVQVLPMRRAGFRYAARVDLGDRQAREALTLMVPRAIGLTAGQLTFVVATAVASGLGAGAVAAFSIAFSVFQIPLGVIGIPMGIVAMPTLAAHLARGEVGRYVDLLTRSLRLLLWAVAPLTVLGIVLRQEVAALLFQYGQIDTAAVALVAAPLGVLLLGLASESAVNVLARAFYAARNTLIPVLAALVAVAVNCVLMVVVGSLFGLPGMSLAIVVGSWIEFVLLLGMLRRRIRAFAVAGLVRVGLAALAAALVAGAAGWAVLSALAEVIGPAPGAGGYLVEVIAVAAVGGAVFLAVSAALRIPELPTMIRLMRDAVRRPAHP